MFLIADCDLCTMIPNKNHSSIDPKPSGHSKCCKLLVKIQRLCDHIESETKRREKSMTQLKRAKIQTAALVQKIQTENAVRLTTLEAKKAKISVEHNKMLQSIEKANSAALANMSSNYDRILNGLKMEIETLEQQKQKAQAEIRVVEVKETNTQETSDVNKNSRNQQFTSESKVTNSEFHEVKPVEVRTNSFGVLDMKQLQKIDVPPRHVPTHSERFAQQLKDAEKRLISRLMVRENSTTDITESMTKPAASHSKVASFLTDGKKTDHACVSRGNDDPFIQIKGSSVVDTSACTRSGPPKKDFRLPVPQCLSPSSMDNAATSRLDADMEKEVGYSLPKIMYVPKHCSDNTKMEKNEQVARAGGQPAGEGSLRRRASQPHEAVDCIQNLMLKFQQLVPK